MKKKFIVPLICMGAALCFAFSGCQLLDKLFNGNNDSRELEGAQGIDCSETYEGKLSETSYATSDAAIEAYIENEIGNGAEVTGSKKEKDLSQSEIAELPLTTGQRGALTSAEEYTVTYVTVSQTASAAVGFKLADSASGEVIIKTRRVYLLVINGKVFYLDPIPATGDGLSKSYYDAVLSFDNYTNCTITQTSSVKVTADDESVNMTVDLTVRIDNGKCYYSLVQGYDGKTLSSAYYYLNETESGLTVYQSSDGESFSRVYGSITLQNGSTVKHISDMILFCDYDYSYLQKTETGFTLQEEYFDGYVENALSSLPDCTLDDACLYYYVSDGAVVKCYGRIAAQCDLNGKTYTVTSETDALVSDFGTTTVSVNVVGN